MTHRLPVRKTYKLYIGGAFPRSESGRTYEAEGQNVARASRKDVRDAVRAARGALPGWAGATAYNRGQVLYRLAEMMEARADDLARVCSGRARSKPAIDRVVWYAGWADKLPQVLGGSNPVGGPYFNFTVPEPTGVVAIVAPGEPALGGLVSRVVPALVGGNTVVAWPRDDIRLPRSSWRRRSPRPTCLGGAVNILTGFRDELAPVLAAPHGRQCDRPDRRGGRRCRARACGGRERQTRHPLAAGGSEPVGDRALPRAEDRLAPGRPQ